MFNSSTLYENLGQGGGTAPRFLHLRRLRHHHYPLVASPPFLTVKELMCHRSVHHNTGFPTRTEPGISLIILLLMRILQRNLKRTYLIV